MAVSLQFLSRSTCAVQALASASPRILSATPKSVCGSPTAPTSRRSFLSAATPKTPARSPYSAAANGGTSPFFGPDSPVWSDFEMAARAAVEASAQLSRLAQPSAKSARDHCLAHLAGRGSSKSLEVGSRGCSIRQGTHSAGFRYNPGGDQACTVDLSPSCDQPRLGLGGRRARVGGGSRAASGLPLGSSGSSEFKAQLPVMLGNARRVPVQALRQRYTEEQVPGMEAAAEAAALVRENVLRRRALIAERAAFLGEGVKRTPF